VPSVPRGASLSAADCGCGRRASRRRECLDHIVILGEIHLLRILAGYFAYYNRSRCHLSLQGDAPEPRLVQGPELGRVVELPEVGGLHHRYERERAAA
jgi:putative transposase